MGTFAEQQMSITSNQLPTKKIKLLFSISFVFRIYIEMAAYVYIYMYIETYIDININIEIYIYFFPCNCLFPFQNITYIPSPVGDS